MRKFETAKEAASKNAARENGKKFSPQKMFVINFHMCFKRERKII